MSENTHYRSCTLCEAMCGITVTTQEDKVVSIKGDKDDPFSRGYVCPKASALAELHEDPDRLREPMIKEQGAWRTASWKEALDKAADLMHGVQQQYGNDALSLYLGNPNAHNFGTIYYFPRFINMLKTRNRFSATSLDQLPHMFAAHHMFGHQLLLPVPDVDRTDYMMILGGNPLASNGSIMTAPDIRNRLKGVKKRGKLIVLDPRRTETAELASEHHFIKPGTDVALLMAMTHVLCHELPPKLNHLDSVVTQLAEVRRLSADWSPEYASGITGVAADTIRDFAQQLHSQERAVCYGRMGTSVQRFGGLCNWLLHVINILSGNMDVEGGMMFTTPAVDLINAPPGLGASKGNWNRWQSRVRQLPEFDGELPSACMAEEMEEPGKGQIKGMLTMAGNPVLSAPNGRRLEAAMDKLEGMVSIDAFLNETSKHADVILPPVSPLERSHYDMIFHTFAVRNTAKFSPPLFEKPKGAMEDWQIMHALNERMQQRRGQNSLRERATRIAERQLTPERFLAGYFHTLSPYRAIKGKHAVAVSMKKLLQNPHGIDLGPLESKFPQQLFTKDKSINLAPQLMLNDLPRLNAQWPAGEGGNADMLLIGRRHIRSVNSWMHNAPKLKKGKDFCTLLIHPDSAEQLGLSHGAMAKVTSAVGEVEIATEVCDSIMPGVVSIPHGYGHHRDKTGMQVAKKKPGVSINDLTDEQQVDALTGNAVLNGTQVSVSAVA